MLTIMCVLQIWSCWVSGVGGEARKSGLVPKTEPPSRHSLSHTGTGAKKSAVVPKIAPFSCHLLCHTGTGAKKSAVVPKTTPDIQQTS